MGIKADYLCDALQCSKTELFARLILAEWKRQGEPVSDRMSNYSEVVVA